MSPGSSSIPTCSDYPFGMPERVVAAVRALGFDDAEERAVFHDNAAALPGCVA